MNGSPLEPSASIITYSAISHSFSAATSLGHSFFSSPSLAMHTARPFFISSRASSSVGFSSVGMCRGTAICVVVITATLCSFSSSLASVYIIVVFPPPPIMAVAPRCMFINSASSMAPLSRPLFLYENIAFFMPCQIILPYIKTVRSFSADGRITPISFLFHCFLDTAAGTAWTL